MEEKVCPGCGKNYPIEQTACPDCGTMLVFVLQNGCCALLGIVTATVFCILLFVGFRRQALKNL